MRLLRSHLPISSSQAVNSRCILLTRAHTPMNLIPASDRWINTEVGQRTDISSSHAIGVLHRHTLKRGFRSRRLMVCSHCLGVFSLSHSPNIIHSATLTMFPLTRSYIISSITLGSVFNISQVATLNKSLQVLHHSIRMKADGINWFTRNGVE